jgi:hypothetical protein
MAKRNIIDEILSKKKRLPFAKNRRWDLVSSRLSRIRQTIYLLDMLLEITANQETQTAQELFDELIELTNSQIDSSKVLDLTDEISRYIPIGLVSCIEGYFRVVYADLLNFGSPYRENASKLDTKFSFNIEIVFALEKSSVSSGEYVAHMLQTSSLDDINNIMSILSGENFLTEFKKEFANYQKNQIQLSLFPMDDEDLANHVIVDIKRLFELRHMYAHEIDPPIDTKDFSSIWRGADATFKFIWNSERILDRLLATKP